MSTRTAWEFQEFGISKYVKECDIRHKDIKPQNILNGDSGPSLTNFGIAMDFNDNIKMQLLGSLRIPELPSRTEELKGVGERTFVQIFDILDESDETSRE
ncbi:hypothetical protein OEA41_001814 [Lepraria neglecta]|uniref:Protein kinase domain-containing protein n=1 Tax=Lepraria neglecta TaxID=209136 RepID=A0AAD9ZDT3_9LECA|nr:hypothetical protein OEA41_001814 [Lepraria neglecta]